MTSVVHIIIINIIVICCCLEGTQNRRGHTYHCVRINTIIMGGYVVCMFGGVVSEAYKKILKGLILFPDRKEFPRWNSKKNHNSSESIIK
jgi:hypothetical protein